MSHVVELKTQFKNMDAVKAVAEKRGVVAEFAKAGQTLAKKLYEGTVAGVAALGLKGWRYPVMVQADGSCKYDNYNGSWGAQSELDGFAQDYGKEVSTSHLRRAGYRLQQEKVEADGTVEMVFVGA